MKKLPQLSRFTSSFFSIGCLVNIALLSLGSLGLGFFQTSAVVAQSIQVPLTVSRQQNESYGNFIQRATKLTVAQLKNRFSQNSALNQVRIVVIGENNGVVAPVLSVNMNRQQWLSHPNPEPLINYFQDSQFLLGFETLTPPKSEKSSTLPSSSTSAPNPTTSPTPTSQPNSAEPKKAPTAKPPSTPNQSPVATPVPLPDAAPSPTPPKMTPANALNNRFRQAAPSQSN